MRIPPFALERFFARYEFAARYLLSASDCESISLEQLLKLADAETLHLWHNLNLGYTESLGHPMLRQEIAQLYERIDPADVLVAAPEEAIFLLMNALLEPGDHVIVTFPAYQSLYEIPQSMGCSVTRWHLRATPDGWQLDLDELRDSITGRTRMLVVNLPHNPTGFLPDMGQWQAIVEIAREHRLVFFCDEMYRFLEHRPADRLPAACDAYELGISLFGLSKTYALPGLRIGWLATRNRDVVQRLSQLKDYTTICNSAPSEVLALMALRARSALIARSRDIIAGNLALARPFFEDRPEWFGWASSPMPVP